MLTGGLRPVFADHTNREVFNAIAVKIPGGDSISEKVTGLWG